MEQYEILIGIMSGLIVIIPLAIYLVRYLKDAVQDKDWGKILDLVIDLMKQAEEQFDKGSDKKQWVLGMIEASANSLNYDIDLEQIGKLIDSLCAMAKIVNVPKK